jgi:hypothetical protein
MGVEWIKLSQDSFLAVSCCECGDEPSGSDSTDLDVRQ